MCLCEQIELPVPTTCLHLWTSTFQNLLAIEMQFLIIAWKFSGSLNSLAQVLKIAEWAQAGHKTVTVIVHEREGEEEVLPHSFSGCGLQLHPDKQMKVKDTDHFYSDDASWAMMTLTS